MSKNPPDLWARILGTLGILIALGSLALGYANYRWDRQKYAESQEERIFVQLSAAYIFLSVPLSPNTESPQGQLAVEVVNLGQQPMYLKSITGEVAGHRVSFYKHDPLNAKEPMRRLEQGEAADYPADWQWSLEDAGRGMPGTVEVETTKKRFPPRAAQVNRVTVSTNKFIALGQLIPRKKVRPPRHK